MAARPMTHIEAMESLPPADAEAIRRSAAEVAAAAPPFSIAAKAELSRVLAGVGERILADRERRAREVA